MREERREGEAKRSGEHWSYLSLTERDGLDSLVEHAHGFAELEQRHHGIGAWRQDEYQGYRR